MRVAFHHIAYQPLAVCNALSMARLEATVRRAGLKAEARVLDIGCAYGEVSIHLARTFDARLTAVELDPVMAAGAEARIQTAGLSERIEVRRETSTMTLATLPAFDLILAIGSTEPAGKGLRDPADVFAALTEHLTPGGALLWGDLFWKQEPPAPLRQLVETGGYYVTHDALQAAAREAGLTVVSAEISDEAEWAVYRTAMETAITDWLDTHPDHADAPSVAATAHRIKMMLDFGAPYLGFGLYLFRKG
ncbi:methyltransferase domain-containing protein [Brevundimonas pondensis]|uniref:Methyltransferase domain-containing protein n=1 Tax=Brevundimonas pondensis TaxID=2774189 RepID=A0ABX7SN54_9CAUL|nr:methyltransferase domain-containing protein [Brevundimonas pondensis]QTC87873.1 methyltransferase domain-containing protein [Brevundimonas pondensis]